MYHIAACHLPKVKVVSDELSLEPFPFCLPARCSEVFFTYLKEINNYLRFSLGCPGQGCFWMGGDGTGWGSCNCHRSSDS